MSKEKLSLEAELQQARKRITKLEELKTKMTIAHLKDCKDYSDIVIEKDAHIAKLGALIRADHGRRMEGDAMSGETMMRCKCTKHEIGDGPIECGTLIHTEDFCGGRHAYEIVLRDRKISELEVKVAELSGHYVVLEKLTVETRDALKDLRTLLVEKGLSWTASSDDLKF